MFLLILSATIIIYILRFHYELVRAVFLSMKISGPKAYPIIGNGLMFINNTSAENFTVICNLIKKYGEFVRIWLGPELNVIVSDPKDVEIILSSPHYIEKSMEYQFVKPWLNEGLLISTGKKWFERRKIITPAFHFKILEQFVEVFDRLGTTVVDQLKKFDAEDDVEFYPIAVLYTLDVMCETAMGVSVNALSKPDSAYVRAVKKIAYVIHTRMLDFVLRYPIFFQYSALFKQQQEALKILHDFTGGVIQNRRQDLLTLKINNNENSDEMNKEKSENEAIGIREKRAFLDLLLHSTVNGKPLNDLEVREEVDTFMFEGHDTTTSGITFCLYNIGRSPAVQKKCFEEIVEIFGKDTKAPTTLSDLNRLPYLDLVIKETLRLFPSVPLIGRTAPDDIQLTNDRVIPAGSNVIVSIYSMNHSPKNFPDPEAFIPERFINERSYETHNPFSYVPFSAGPRNCIGQRFAMYEMKSIVSKILRNFEVQITKESEGYPVLSAELVLRPETRISFYFKPRVY